MQSKKNVVFVGDSYCSSWNNISPIPHYYSQQKNEDPTKASWLDVVATELDLNLYSFGFAGRSWYYSRKYLFEHMEYDPDWIKSVDLMVFCHTNSSRMNTGNGDIGTEMLDPGYRPHNNDPGYQDKINLSESVRRWVVDLIDRPFQDWAQEQWFYEIARTFKDIKQIHFNNFTYTIDKTSAILPGVIYTTPLIHLSIGEATGTDNEVIKNFMTGDQRVNHLNAHNNRALGKLVVDTVKNYQPGLYSIDASKFYFINPNATRWPEPGFGSC